VSELWVPGSPVRINHPFSWYAVVKEKATGKQWTYWMNGNHLDRESLAEHIRVHFPNVEAVTIDRCTQMPTRPLQRIPAAHYEMGILKAVERELMGEAISTVAPPLPRRTLPRQTLPRDTLPRQTIQRQSIRRPASPRG
jgi:hypothetical protein